MKVCLSLLGTWAGPGWDPATSTILQVASHLPSTHDEMPLLVECPLVAGVGVHPGVGSGEGAILGAGIDPTAGLGDGLLFQRTVVPHDKVTFLVRLSSLSSYDELT